jgi:hypothetical protein
MKVDLEAKYARMEALLLKRDAEHVRFFALLKIDECVAQLFDYFFLNRKCYQKKLVA